MGGTGRKPYVTHDVTPFGLPDERLKPPDHLGPLEKRVFFHLITHAPAGQFREVDLSLVCRWCELSAVADRAAAELATGNLVTEDGRPTPWLSVHERAVKGLVALSLRLQLAPQSRASKAPKTSPAGTLSYYEQMALEGDDGDGDPDCDRTVMHWSVRLLRCVARARRTPRALRRCCVANPGKRWARLPSIPCNAAR